MPFINELAQAGAGQAASGIIGNTIGLATQGIANKQQLKQQRKLQNMALEGHYAQSQFDQKQAMKFWEDTNYSAQVEQMEKAGLSKGLMYGMKGGGGTSIGPSSGSPGMATSSSFKPEAGAPGMGLTVAQMGLMKAQERNLNADSLNKEIDAKNKDTGGVVNKNIQQDTDSKAATAELTKTQTAIAKIQEQVQNQSIQDQITSIANAAKEGSLRIANMAMRNTITASTMNEQISLIISEAAGAIIENKLKQSNIYVNSAQIKKWAADIAQGWTNLNRQERELKLKEFETKFRVEHPTFGQVTGGILESIKDFLMNPQLNPIQDLVDKVNKMKK